MTYHDVIVLTELKMNPNSRLSYMRVVIISIQTFRSLAQNHSAKWPTWWRMKIITVEVVEPVGQSIMTESILVR